MGASTTVNLANYHKRRYGHNKPSPEYKVDRIYAGDLGYVTASPTVNGVSDKWQGIQVIPIATNDEIHFAWATPHNFDYRFPVYVRWGVFATAASKSATCTTTYDQVDSGDTAADGATALTDTIPAVTPGANIVNFTYWGKTTTTPSSDYDMLFLKMVAESCTTADNVKIWCLEVAYKPRV